MTESISSRRREDWHKVWDREDRKEYWIKLFTDKVRIQETYSVLQDGSVGDFINRIYLIEPYESPLQRSGYHTRSERQLALDIVLFLIKEGYFSELEARSTIERL